jgi:hypothetical protein
VEELELRVKLLADMEEKFEDFGGSPSASFFLSYTA